MKFQLAEAINILSRTPSVLNALLLHLPEGWAKGGEGANTWSPHNVVSHLISGEETDWIVRAQTILEKGTEQPFEPFDRYSSLGKLADQRLDTLLQTYADLRRKNLTRLRQWNLTDEQLDKTGLHPEFGIVKLRQLLATWVVHDLSHLAQINRVMCKQYDEAVGPWKAYLPILDR